jgi:hypothetical protein
MEVSAQVSYNGYRADYKINSFDSTFYHVELINFSGLKTESPPSQFSFIKVKEQIIASSDIITIARDLSEQLGLCFSLEPSK